MCWFFLRCLCFRFYTERKVACWPAASKQKCVVRRDVCCHNSVHCQGLLSWQPRPPWAFELNIHSVFVVTKTNFPFLPKAIPKGEGGNSSFLRHCYRLGLNLSLLRCHDRHCHGEGCGAWRGLMACWQLL